VPEHDDHKCGEAGDVDGAVAVRRSVFATWRPSNAGLVNGMKFSMPAAALSDE